MPSQSTEILIPGPTPHTVRLQAENTNLGADVAQQSIQLPTTVAENSAYLRARIRSSSENSDTIVIGVPDVEPAALRLYAWWLQFGDAPLFLHDETGPVSQPRRTLIWRECFDLIQAHILGSRFDDVNFQRYILGQFDQWLAPQQEPDRELLDYLWEMERAFVSEDLLCFVIGHMFHIEQRKAGVLVAWMTGLIQGRQLMDNGEGIRGVERREMEASTTRTRKALSLNKMKADRRKTVSKSGTEVSAAAQGVLVDEPVSRDKTPSSLYDQAASRIRQPPDATKWASSGGITTTTSRGSQYGKDASAPRPGSSAIRRKPTQLARKQLFLQGKFNYTPQVSGIHPKALASIANTNIHAEIETQRTSSPRLPPLPSLHPMIRQGLANSATEEGPHSSQPELRGGAHSRTSFNNAATMPAIPHTCLQLLDFWTDPSPADLPGPDFWAGLPSETRPPIPLKDKPAVSEPAQIRSLSPPYSPTTKQFIQSFTLTRTPTPRRRATRSWSVASIRSLEKEKPAHKKSVIDRPGRGLISRKPVPQEGMEFLRRFVDGERLMRMVSVNSRPEGLHLIKDGGGRGGEDVWERGWDVRRPGTA